MPLIDRKRIHTTAVRDQRLDLSLHCNICNAEVDNTTCFETDKSEFDSCAWVSLNTSLFRLVSQIARGENGMKIPNRTECITNSSVIQCHAMKPVMNTNSEQPYMIVYFNDLSYVKTR
jgi:hypothetical protein